MGGSRKIIDIHAHVLPGVDDGARNIEEAKELLKQIYDQGAIGVVATPHYSRRRVTQGLEQLTETLEQEIRKECPGFFVCLGQETYYHDQLVERLQKKEAFTMADSAYVLVEFAETVSYHQLFQGSRRLLGAGYLPVLAHIERYRCLRGEGLEELIALGCFLQMNYDSLCGAWYQAETRWCRKQVADGKIHLLATDMHRTSYRPPNIEEAWHWLERHVREDEIIRMTYRTPLRMLEKKIKDL